jgi:Thioredoxin-like domain/Thioredoxin
MTTTTIPGNTKNNSKKMAPMLRAVAPKLTGKMAIGKIDCTKQPIKPLCKQYHVKGFPSIKYSVDGELYDYPGGRDEASLLAFADKMATPPITVIHRLDEATRFAQRETGDHGVAFLGTDRTMDASSSRLYEIFSKVARKQQALAYFLWLEQDSTDPKTAGKDSAFVHRIETGVVEPRQWEGTDVSSGADGEGNPTGMTFDALDRWVREHNVPTIVTFGPTNFQKISKNGRPLAMAIVDLDNAEMVNAVRAHLMDYILKTPQQLVDKYYYGVFDGKRWSKFLEQFHVKREDNPQFLLLEMGPDRKYVYWRNETYSKFGDFVRAVWDGDIEGKKPDKTGYRDSPLGFVVELFADYMPFSMGIVIVAVCVIVILVTPTKEELRSRVIETAMTRAWDGTPEDDTADGSPSSVGDNQPASADESKKDK